MAEFLYPSRDDPAEVLARLRAVAGRPLAAIRPSSEDTPRARVVVDTEGPRFRVRIARPGRRQWDGPVAAGEVRAVPDGSELAGAIRASRADLVGSAIALCFGWWMGRRTGEPMMALLMLAFGAGGIAATFPWADEEREAALHAVLAAAAAASGEAAAPEFAVRDG